jgi:uncharacterized protein YndB with AHSA1/START domain
MNASVPPADLPQVLARSIAIRARRPTVFGFFTDSARFAAWWGEGSSIDPRPGGAVRIRYPNGVEAHGEVLELTPPERVVFSYGYPAADAPVPLPVGGSRVEIALEEVEDGTVLHLRHFFAEAAARDRHVQGWRYQLALFANAVAAVEHAAAAERVDAWFALWAEPDPGLRRQRLAALVTDGVELRDAWACLAGREELAANLDFVVGMARGARVERRGEVRACQGSALADWEVVGGFPGRGTNAFEFAPDGRIASVVGFWNPPGTR